MHEVGALIARDAAELAGRWDLVVEGLYIAALARGPSVITLAESAGEIAGPLGGLAGALRPNATRWRAKVLRLSRGMAADAAEAYAVRCVGSGAVVDNPEALGDLAGDGHVAEAVCLATFGTWDAAWK